jgi:hypothetical protein
MGYGSGRGYGLSLIAATCQTFVLSLVVLPVSLSLLKSQIRKCMQKAAEENEEAHENQPSGGAESSLGRTTGAAQRRRVMVMTCRTRV